MADAILQPDFHVGNLNPEDRPLAAHGLTSYRCKGRFGWIMIGALDHTDAMSEARRSSPEAKTEDLQVWDGNKYIPVQVSA